MREEARMAVMDMKKKRTRAEIRSREEEEESARLFGRLARSTPAVVISISCLMLGRTREVVWCGDAADVWCLEFSRR